jgi:ABC-type thiamine transport system substrate-binding protein
VTVLNPDGIAILKGAPNLSAAELFVEFVMSGAGQRLLMAPIGAPGGPRQFRIARMAVMPAVYDEMGSQTLVQVNPFKMRAAIRYDSAKAAVRWKLLNDLIGALIVENHEPLKDAWRAVAECDATTRAALTRKLAAMPLTEEEALDLARQKWKDPVARNRTLLEWSAFAREKYAAVLEEARQAKATADRGAPRVR